MPVIRVLSAAAGVLLIAASMFAQPGTHARLGRFVIGVDQVGGTMQFPPENAGRGVARWLEWVSDARLPIAGASDPRERALPPARSTAAGEADSIIPAHRWEQLHALGIDLAFVHVKGGALRGTGGIARIRDAARTAGVELGIADRELPTGLLEMSNAERRYYHVESRWAYHPDEMIESGTVPDTASAFNPAFRDWLGGFPLDQSPRELARRKNCRHMRSKSSTGLYLARRDGSSSQDPADVPDQDQVFFNTDANNSGRYILSVRLMARRDGSAPLPPADTPLLRVSLIDGQRRKLDWHLRMSDLLDAQGRLPSAPREIVLGAVLLTDLGRAENGSRVVGASTADPWTRGDDAWNIGINARSDMGLPEGGRALYLSISSVAPNDRTPSLDVDALILSSALGFALFQPGHARVLPALRDARARLVARIDSLCAVRDNGAPVRMLMANESTQGDGNAAALALLARLVDSVSRGTAQVFMYTNGGGYNKYQSMARAFTGALSGYYWYPLSSVRRNDGKHWAEPGDPHYYDEHYGVHGKTERAFDDLGTMCTSYRRMAIERRNAPRAADWIPAIQNHTWEWTAGLPDGTQAGDPCWLREPTVAENRLLVNLALAYGARGIMYYCFQSTPGKGPWDAPGSDAGMIGLLDPDQKPRTRDRYGESKWDSVAVFNRACLRDIGNLLYPLEWVDGCSVERGLEDSGLHSLVSFVRAESRGADVVVDPARETLVECALFRPAEPTESARYLFLVNKRVDVSGWRHLRVGFPPGSARLVRDPLRGASWKVGESGGEIDLCLGPGNAVVLRVE